MEDTYVTPGNQDRGWNDPPQFSYGYHMARGPQKNLLNKRAAPPTASGAGAPPMTPPSSNPQAPPPNSINPPPKYSAHPPPSYVATPPPLGPMRSQRVADSCQSESEPDVELAVLVLNRALAACKEAIQDQVCKDVAKRLHLLEDSWRSGRLSLPVRRRMYTLCLELKSGRWDSADEIHRALMVDHVTEVSQWMVGVKRLIAETRKLSPELLEPLRKLAEPTQDKPAQVSAEPVHISPKPVDNSAEPVDNSAEPVHESAGPVQKSAEPVDNSADLAQDPVSQS